MHPHDADAALVAAQQFYAAHRGEHLTRDRHRLVGRCTRYLMAELGVSRRAAEDAAMQVAGDLTAGGVDSFIDLPRCTGRMVVVRDTRSGTNHMVSIGELLDLIRARDAPAGRVMHFANRAGSDPPALR